jgi:hypothetical protein
MSVGKGVTQGGHVNIIDLVSLSLKGLPDTEPAAMEFEEEERRAIEVQKVLDELNGLEGCDIVFLPALIRHWGSRQVSEWRAIIGDARDIIVARSASGEDGEHSTNEKKKPKSTQE